MKIIKLKITGRFKAWLKKADESDLKIKAISLSIAFLLHLALVLYLRQAKIFIKIWPFERETEVVIAPYPEVTLPSNFEEIINQPPGAGNLFPAMPGQGQPSDHPGGKGKTQGQGEESGSAGREASLPGKGAPGKVGQPSIPFNLGAYLEAGRDEISPPSGIRLNLSTRFKSFDHYYFSLKLPVSPEGEKKTGEPETTPPLQGDLFRYIKPKAYEQPGKNLRFTPAGRPVLPGGSMAGGSGGGRVSAGSGTSGGYAYNIRPWAEKVINFIQAKWLLPQIAVLPKGKNVVLMIRVDRQGELQFLDITTSSTNELLDEAAIAAVKLCAPFPPLPDDFPGKSLEFYLIFTYHD
ncbi:MAG: cell envelope integrity protein TolA [Acidobacteriota bacterium]|nr:cell envelope integrity protein TolA [Acidobacteriota bacterium]